MNRLHERIKGSREQARLDYINLASTKPSENECLQSRKQKIQEFKELYERHSNNLYLATGDKSYIRPIV